MTRFSGGFGIAAALLLAAGLAAGKKQKIFEQNCAAHKRCNIPLDQRDPAVHHIPEKLQGKVPKGHLKPLGHPDFDDSWAGEIDVFTEDVDPKTFWTKYWPKRPFLLKGFAKKSPAFTKWKDDDYLVKEFGDFKAKCEPKNEDRLTDYCNQRKFGQMIQCEKDIIPYTETHMKVKKFVPRMKDISFDKYIITQMPDAMGKDFVVPNFHSCGRRHPADKPKGREWTTQMYENNFWLSHNGGHNFSTSVIHYDMNHQIMCLFDGTKEWFMWDLSTEIDKIPTWSSYYNKASHTAQGSDDSPIDGERVDLRRWPNFAKAKWWNATMEAGDCLFTPALLLHYVRSWGRNAAAMTMFQREEKYDPECNGFPGGKPPADPLPLSEYDTMWSFPEEDKSLFGWNLVKMGYPNWKRQFLFQLADSAQQSGGKLSKAAFSNFMKQLGVDEQGRPMKGWKKRTSATFASMDTDSDGFVEPEQLFKSRELRFMFKDASVMQEGGRGDQEENVEVDRYDLKGNTVHRQAEL